MSKKTKTQTASSTKIAHPERKRGAQPGNKNALKHGFYSDQFKQAERRALNDIPMADLTGEIELMRVQMHRCLKAENQVESQLTYEDHLSAMRAFSHAADSITRLGRLQTLLNLQDTEWKEIEKRINAIPLEDQRDS